MYLWFDYKKINNDTHTVLSLTAKAPFISLIYMSDKVIQQMVYLFIYLVDNLKTDGI